MIAVQQQGDAVTFGVRVHPKARREGITGVVGDALKLDLTALALEGKANEACIRFFAEFLKVSRSSVTIAAGAKSRGKVIRVSGINVIQVQQALASALKQSL